MEKLFLEYLEKSDELRDGYKESLLPVNNDWNKILLDLMGEIPDLLKVIYSNVSGTLYEIEDQKLMDFVPGHLLVHISEYKKSYENLFEVLTDHEIDDKFYPILQDYSSNFIALKAETNEIYGVSPEEGVILMYKTPLKFFETLNDFYSKEVYFLDEDGFLDYDFELESEVGKKYNPEIQYWNEN
jgi:hypothetical protein